MSYRLDPHGSLVAVSNSTSPSPRTGYIIVRPDSSQLAPITGAVFTLALAGKVVATTGVAPAAPSKQVRVYVDRRNNHDAGVALVNVGSQSAALRITAANLQGAVRGTARAMTLGPAHQMSLFASQLVPDLPEGFRGSILLESDVPVATMAMRSTSSGGRFLLATLPVVDLSQPAAVKTCFFPHLADGGGYTSEFILLNPRPESAWGRLRFFTTAGVPLPLVAR